jgi:RNA polymerase sigma factor (sigma-70 family)
MAGGDATIEDLARQAVDGDRDAVHGLVRALQADVYSLALRMLWHREDAEDATQEILVRVITRLSQFDFRSRLRTWVYRVASNYLLDVKKSPVEKQRLTFEQFADDLAQGQSAAGPPDEESSLLVEEVKIGCTLAMLQCLDRPHRLAYVLGEVLDLSAPEGAEALGVDAAAFRKRLQRSRERIESFTREHCGLVAESAACQCNRRVPAAVERGRVRADALQFAREPTSFTEAREHVRRLEHARRTLEVYRASNPSGSSMDFAARVASALESVVEH